MIVSFADAAIESSLKIDDEIELKAADDTCNCDAASGRQASHRHRGGAAGT